MFQIKRFVQELRWTAERREDKKYALASPERTTRAAEKEQARKELRSLLQRSLFSSLRIRTITCTMYVCTCVYLNPGIRLYINMIPAENKVRLF